MMNKMVRPMAKLAKMTSMQALVRQQFVLNQTRQITILNKPVIMNTLISNSKSAFSSGNESHSLYIQDLSEDVTEESLRQAFPNDFACIP